jgi:hypothetical protein
MKLHLFRNSDIIDLKWYSNQGKLRRVLENGEGLLGYCCKEDNTIGLNIDKVSKFYNFLRIPQIIVHELLHYSFPNENVSVCIHKINDITHGLIL